MGDNVWGFERVGEALAQLLRRLRLRHRPLLHPHGPPGANLCPRLFGESRQSKPIRRTGFDIQMEPVETMTVHLVSKQIGVGTSRPLKLRD